MPQAVPPSGPRTPRPSGRVNTSRQISRGGIQKRNGSVRTDKDGDLVMDAAATSRGGSSGRDRGLSVRGSAQARRHGTPESTNSRSSAKPARRALDPFSIQKTVLRSMGSEAATKGSRIGARAVKKREHEHRTTDGLDNIRVLGLKESNAATNQDGGVAALVGFLERKASERKTSNSTASTIEPVKILKVCLTLKSAGHQQHRFFRLSGPLSFKANTSERRPRYADIAPG